MKAEGAERGQVLVEGCVGLGVVAVFFAAALPLLATHWAHFRCTRALFEQTHRVLIGAISDGKYSGIRISVNEDRVVGRARCGRKMETVTLRKI